MNENLLKISKEELLKEKKGKVLEIGLEYSCPNCNHKIEENFCPNCGQKKYSRIDRTYVLKEIQYTILHTDKGFLYTVKNILSNPGKTAREFIDGNRVNHYKPILLAFVLSGISTFISYKILGLHEIITAYYTKQNMGSDFLDDYVSFMASYNSILMLLAIPLFAVTTKLAFINCKENYYEHVVINAYLLSLYTLVQIIIFYPIYYFLENNGNFIFSLTYISFLTLPLILIWFFRQFYKDLSWKSIIGRVMLVLLLTSLGFFMILILAAIFGFVLAFLKGPEALEYFRPH